MADGDDLCPFQQSLADSRLFRRFTQRGGYGVFSNGRPATSLNRVHKTAGQRLEAGAGIVLAGDENDMAEIIQKNGIRRMPEMYARPLDRPASSRCQENEPPGGVVAKSSRPRLF